MPTYYDKLKDKKLGFIAIDNFQLHLFNCTTFMLSHFHKDHMCGINNQWFKTTFDNVGNDTVLYMNCIV